MFGRANASCLAALGFTLVAAGASIALAADTSGRTKIQFSTPADTVRLPEEKEANARSSGSLELLDKGNSMGAALDRPTAILPAPPARSGSSARTLERLERDKNWMQNRPEDRTSAVTAEEAMGVWNYDFNRALGVREAGGDRSIARSDATKEALPPALDPGRSDSAVPGYFGLHTAGGLGTPGRSDQGFGSNPLLAPPSLWLQPKGTAGTPPTPSGLMSSSELFPRAEPNQANRIVPDIRDLLGLPNLAGPFSGGLDPINLNVDSTRRQVNPVTAPSLNDLRAGQRFDTALALPPPSPALESPPTVLDEMTAKIQGPSSLSPAAPTPIEAPKSRFRPDPRESFGRKL
jgi:hypothetical protein